ncbi:hypothetical protein [Aeromicrobium sp. P5_D10]
MNKRPTPTSPKTFQVTGMAGIPSTGVSAVVLDVSASSGTGVTNVYLRTNPADTTVSMLTVGGDSSVNSNTAVVKPSTTGQVTVAVNAQPVALTVDVQGYFTDSSVSGQAGGFVPIEPARLVGTHAGFGLPQAKLNAGTTYTASIAGQAGIPENATAVFANVRVVNSTTDGWIQVGPAGTNLNAIPTGTYYESGHYEDTGMTFKLGSGGTSAGKVGILLSAGAADVIIDIQGYFTSAEEEGAGFTPLPQTHYYDTRTVPAGTLKAGEERVIEVAGKAGIPGDESVGAIVTTILATGWTATGSVTLYNSDLEDVITSNIGFQGTYSGEPSQSTSVVELSSGGEVTLRNNSAGTVHVVLAVQGWFGFPFSPDEPESPGPDLSESEFAPGTDDEGNPYIEADSPTEALQTLDALEAGLLRTSVKYGPCVLYPSPIRIRTDGNVGTKPHTKCSTAVTAIAHKTDMRYKSFIWWKLRGSKPGGNRGQKSYYQKNVSFKCKSKEESWWGSTTLGEVRYGDKTYYARVYPAHAKLKCGG